MKEFFTVCGFGFLILFVIYLASRLASAGYYKSKKDFLQWYHRVKDERKNNGSTV